MAAWCSTSVTGSRAGRNRRHSPAFREGACIDATDPELPTRDRSLQLLYRLELLAGSSERPPDALVRLLLGHVDAAHRGADISVSEQALQPGQIAGRAI
jgi:hypothetical protein